MNENEDLCPDWHGTPILFKKGDKIIYDELGCHIIPMADPNTCEQCGVSNHNRPSVIIRQSGKGKLVCQACYDIINPPEVETIIDSFYTKDPPTRTTRFVATKIKEVKENIDEKPKHYGPGVNIGPDFREIEDKNESISSSKTQEEKGTLRNSSKRLQR